MLHGWREMRGSVRIAQEILSQVNSPEVQGGRIEKEWEECQDPHRQAA